MVVFGVFELVRRVRSMQCSIPGPAESPRRKSPLDGQVPLPETLKSSGEDIKVVQELMRHANITTTMNVYTKALTPAKREAQRRVVDILLDCSRVAVTSAAEGAA